MDDKEKVKSRLKTLKELGYDRRRIEKVLGYAEKSLDQNTSRGGTGKLIAALDLLLKYAILERRTQSESDAGREIENRIAGIQFNLDALKQMLLSDAGTSDLKSEIVDEDEDVAGEDTSKKDRTVGKPGK